MAAGARLGLFTCLYIDYIERMADSKSLRSNFQSSDILLMRGVAALPGHSGKLRLPGHSGKLPLPGHSGKLPLPGHSRKTSAARAFRKPKAARAFRKPKAARAFRKPKAARAFRKPKAARAFRKTPPAPPQPKSTKDGARAHEHRKSALSLAHARVQAGQARNGVDVEGHKQIDGETRLHRRDRKRSTQHG